MRKELSGQELKDILREIDFSPQTQDFIQTSFRIRTKMRDTGAYAFQARHDFDGLDPNLDAIQQEIQQKLNDWNFDEVILEYENCCCEGCIGCQRFTGVM